RRYSTIVFGPPAAARNARALNVPSSDSRAGPFGASGTAADRVDRLDGRRTRAARAPAGPVRERIKLQLYASIRYGFAQIGRPSPSIAGRSSGLDRWSSPPAATTAPEVA